MKQKKALLREKLYTRLYKVSAVVVEEYREYHIVFFPSDKSYMAVTNSEIWYLTNDQITEKTRLRYLKDGAEQIARVKSEVDEEDNAQDS